MEKTQPYPWLQMPNEPEDHFKMFDLYLNLIPRRYETVADVFSISTRTVATIAKKWDWQRRIDLYNAYIRDTNWASLDELQQMQKNKLYSQERICRRALDLLDQCSFYLDNLEDLYDNPDVRSKMKFIRELAATIRAVSRLADVRPTKEAWKTQADRQQNLPRLFLDTIGIDPDAPSPNPEINIAAQILHLTTNTACPPLEGESGAIAFTGGGFCSNSGKADPIAVNYEQPTTNIDQRKEDATHAIHATDANPISPLAFGEGTGVRSEKTDATQPCYRKQAKHYRHKRRHH